MAAAFSAVLFLPAAEAREEIVPASAWQVQLNGNIPPAATVNRGGVALMAAPAASLDFPYVSSRTIFPETGDFALHLRVRYTDLGPNGVGVTVLAQDNRLLLLVWADEDHDMSLSLLGVLGGSAPEAIGLGHPTAEREIVLRVVGNRLSVEVDGVERLTEDSDLRPTQMYIGQPAPGQLLGLNADGSRPSFVKVDELGIVTERWWGTRSGAWSGIVVGEISIDDLTPPTLPRLSPAPTIVLLVALVVLAAQDRIRKPLA
jgi:hypothetical protein